MKILWFSNVDLSRACKSSGSWLFSMASSFCEFEENELINITQSSNVTTIKKINVSANLTQYILPVYHLKKGIPHKNNILKIKSIVDQEKPQLVHVWGTESYWGMLAARGYINAPVLLEIQGLIKTVHRSFYANLSPYQLLQTFSLKEILFPNRSLPYSRNRYLKWIPYENEMIQAQKYISVQSQWVEQFIQLHTSNVSIYHSKISVRKPFLNSQWCKTINKDAIRLVTISNCTPYKGLLDMIDILSLLKKKYQNISLSIIGLTKSSKFNIRTSGYQKMIMRRIKKLSLNDNVRFEGSLNADEIVSILAKSDLFIQTSYVESYSLALAEAMAFGIPCVSSSAGAMSELGTEGKNISFYSPGDIYRCVDKILALLNSPKMMSDYSYSARNLGVRRNNMEEAVRRQIEIYTSIIK